MDIKKIAAPGRRTSTKKGSFRGSKLIGGIDYDVESRRRRGEGGGEGDAEDGEDDGDAEAEAQAKEEAEAAAAAEEAAAAAEEEARQAEIVRAQQREARQAAARKEAEEARAREEEEQREIEAAALRVKQSRQRAELEAARLEQERLAAEEAEAAAKYAAKEERARQREAARLEQERLQEEEQRAAAEEEERRAAAEAEEAERAQIERAAKRAQARAEKERLAREEEERAREEAARLLEEQQREEERLREEEEADLNRRIAAEKARREAMRREEEERARAEAEAEAEEERREIARRQEEARAAAAAASVAEDSILAEKRRRAEEQRKKRAMFLSDMDSFSDNFEAKTASQKEIRETAAQQEDRLLRSQISSASGQYTAPVAYSGIRAAEEEESKEARSTQAARNLPPPPQPAASAPAVAPAERVIHLAQRSGADNSKFDEAASSLFSSAGATNVNPMYQQEEGVEELRMASRIGGDKKKAASGATAKPVSPSAPAQPQPVSPTVVSPTPTTKSATSPLSSQPNFSGVLYDDDDAEEGEGALGNLGNFLTRQERMTLTAQEKAAWRAKQGDLTTRRHEFHGAVTYAFDGIFSWQMYGSAEAVDESGRSYTEYLMRCQWGTTWDNLQPWISARRYREFDILDAQLRRLYPTLTKALPSLPEKDFFRFLEADVVQKRRSALEDYMAKIVSSLPSILRSEQFNEFLGINERVVAIRARLTAQERSLVTSNAADSTLNSRRPAEASAPFSPDAENLDNDDESTPLNILTVESAERVREKTNARALDEDELGHLEESVRDLGVLLRNATPQDVSSRGSIRELLTRCCQQWPRLRATAVLGVGVDFSLIPRAMQTEEDLVRIINDFKSLRMALSMT